MSKTANIEAQITTPTGATILIRGDQKDIAPLLSMFTGKESPSHPPDETPPFRGHSGKLDGVAERDEEGNVHIVATDLKAKSAMDAASRLIYVTILARKVLLNEKKTERTVINESLRSYNLYDGNTRNIIPRDKALVCDGLKYVALSGAAMPKAWAYVKEIQDTATVGSWVPGSKRRRPKGKKNKKGS